MIECLKELMLIKPMSHEGVYDLMQKTSSFDNVAIVFVKGNDDRIHFWYISKDKAIIVMGKPDLKEKSGVLYIGYKFYS